MPPPLLTLPRPVYLGLFMALGVVFGVLVVTGQSPDLVLLVATIIGVLGASVGHRAPPVAPALEPDEARLRELADEAHELRDDAAWILRTNALEVENDFVPTDYTHEQAVIEVRLDQIDSEVADINARLSSLPVPPPGGGGVSPPNVDPIRAQDRCDHHAWDRAADAVSQFCRACGIRFVDGEPMPDREQAALRAIAFPDDDGGFILPEFRRSSCGWEHCAEASDYCDGRPKPGHGLDLPRYWITEEIVRGISSRHPDNITEADVDAVKTFRRHRAEPQRWTMPTEVEPVTIYDGGTGATFAIGVRPLGACTCKPGIARVREAQPDRDCPVHGFRLACTCDQHHGRGIPDCPVHEVR